MTVVLKRPADLDGDGHSKPYKADDNHTIVIKNGNVIWDNSGWIPGVEPQAVGRFLGRRC